MRRDTGEWIAMDRERRMKRDEPRVECNNNNGMYRCWVQEEIQLHLKKRCKAVHALVYIKNHLVHSDCLHTQEGINDNFFNSTVITGHARLGDRRYASDPFQSENCSEYERNGCVFKKVKKSAVGVLLKSRELCGENESGVCS